MESSGPDAVCWFCLLATGSDAPDEASGPANDLEAPARGRFGHFEINRHADGSLHELGRGSMGLSYLARDTVLDCPVALKVIDARLSSEPAARTRFLREARTAAQLRHPHVASVFHYGEEAGQCFYAMEFVEGETLEARVRRDGPLTPALALEITAQVAAALVAADARGLVHRDLKPSNIMVSTNPALGEPGQPVVKVIDFGLAKAVAAAAGESRAADLTRGGFVGTPAFASPEQFAALASGKETTDGSLRIDTRSDIYSLGVTLWYLLTGKVPFVGRDLAEIHRRQVQGSSSLEQLTKAKTPTCIVALLRKMLAADPAERPQSPRELVGEISRCRNKIEPARNRARLLVSFLAAALILAAAAYFFEKRTRPGDPKALPPVAAAVAGKSIAVLPFDNRSQDQQNTFFAAGVQDEILIDLSKVADLKVISRASVMPYQDSAKRNLAEIGKTLGVSHVLEGSVQRTSNRIRVTAQLTEIHSTSPQWAEHYEGDLADVFRIQSEIAQSISEELQVRLSSIEKAVLQDRPTNDLVAYDLYLQAKELFHLPRSSDAAPKNLPQAVRVLDEAVSRDPKFFLAYCLLARAHDDIYWDQVDENPARLALAEQAIEHAARLRPDAGEVHLARAIHLYHGLLKLDESVAELDLAVKTLPNNSDIYLFRGSIIKRQGKWEEAILDYEKGIALNPNSRYLLDQLVLTYEAMNRWPEQARVLDRLIQLFPQDLNLRTTRAWVDFHSHADLRPMAALLPLRLAESPATEWGNVDVYNFAKYSRDPVLGARAIAMDPVPNELTNVSAGLFAQMRGDQAAAEVSFKKAREKFAQSAAENPESASALRWVAMLDARLGHREAAIAEGERALKLLPEEWSGSRVSFLLELATIHACLGDANEAIEYLQQVVNRPNGPSYGQMRLEPDWDRVREDPRFEALVQKLAPDDLRRPPAAPQRR